MSAMRVACRFNQLKSCTSLHAPPSHIEGSSVKALKSFEVTRMPLASAVSPKDASCKSLAPERPSLQCALQVHPLSEGNQVFTAFWAVKVNRGKGHPLTVLDNGPRPALRDFGLVELIAHVLWVAAHNMTCARLCP